MNTSKSKSDCQFLSYYMIPRVFCEMPLARHQRTKLDWKFTKTKRYKYSVLYRDKDKGHLLLIAVPATLPSDFTRAPMVADFDFIERATARCLSRRTQKRNVASWSAGKRAIQLEAAKSEHYDLDCDHVSLRRDQRIKRAGRRARSDMSDSLRNQQQSENWTLSFNSVRNMLAGFGFKGSQLKSQFYFDAAKRRLEYWSHLKIIYKHNGKKAVLGPPIKYSVHDGSVQIRFSKSWLRLFGKRCLTVRDIKDLPSDAVSYSLLLMILASESTAKHNRTSFSFKRNYERLCKQLGVADQRADKRDKKIEIALQAINQFLSTTPGMPCAYSIKSLDNGVIEISRQSTPNVHRLDLDEEGDHENDSSRSFCVPRITSAFHRGSAQG